MKQRIKRKYLTEMFFLWLLAWHKLFQIIMETKKKKSKDRKNSFAFRGLSIRIANRPCDCNNVPIPHLITAETALFVRPGVALAERLTVRRFRRPLRGLTLNKWDLLGPVHSCHTTCVLMQFSSICLLPSQTLSLKCGVGFSEIYCKQ